MDRYYTPDSIAEDILCSASLREGVDSVLDPSCGGGALLRAAETLLDAKCIGVDVDRQAIRTLKRTKPHWKLSVANVLCKTSVGRSFVGKLSARPDMLLMNPPFSQFGRKYIELGCEEGIIRASPAMGFLLQSLEIFRPTMGAVAIVPESVLYSDTDAAGRDYLRARFSVRKLTDLKATVFKGARVRSVAVELVSAKVAIPVTEAVSGDCSHMVGLERGCLPVHMRRGSKFDGVPFVHTADLLALVEGRYHRTLAPSGRVHHTAWALFLPRVGVPLRTAVRALSVHEDVRLSDCVIALWCESQESALWIQEEIQGHWNEFCGLYRGTGARYITVVRLSNWLAEHSVAVKRL